MDGSYHPKFHYFIRKAVFKPARNDGGGLTTYSMQVGGGTRLSSALFGRLRRLSALSAPGAFVLRSSFQMIQLKSVFKLRKYFSDFWFL